MIPVRIAGATRNLGAPPNWNPDRDGPCSHLPIRDEVIGQVPYMTSRWELTPDEIARVQTGAPIELSIVGQAHPVVSLAIAEAATPATVRDRLIAAARMVFDVRPTNWADDDDADGVAAWSALEEALRACGGLPS